MNTQDKSLTVNDSSNIDDSLTKTESESKKGPRLAYKEFFPYRYPFFIQMVYKTEIARKNKELFSEISESGLALIHWMFEKVIHSGKHWSKH